MGVAWAFFHGTTAGSSVAYVTRRWGKVFSVADGVWVASPSARSPPGARSPSELVDTNDLSPFNPVPCLAAEIEKSPSCGYAQSGDMRSACATHVRLLLRLREAHHRISDSFPERPIGQQVLAVCSTNPLDATVHHLLYRMSLVSISGCGVSQTPFLTATWWPSATDALQN
ncbi:hypothetical protein EDD16DRAFT_1237165 [Pisolithus croceorrhizus]|nr:hypothetical protein EDD16DRAFT_1237165 [Pisolithus croceorrhizus]